jgi:predicted membrane protein
MLDNFRPSPSGLTWGLAIIAIGCILLLDQMEIVSAHYIFQFFWPAFLIFFGVEGLVFCSGPGRFWGSFLTLAGIVLLLSNLGYLHIRWSMFWPLAIILWGIWILSRTLGGGSSWGTKWIKIRPLNMGDEQGFASDSPELRTDTVFSTSNRRVTSKDFRGGKLAAVFGELKIDLTEAEIQGDEAVIQLDAVFGAVEIRVPTTWIIASRGAAVFGEYSDRTVHSQPSGPGAKRLIVKGGAVFGSVVIKN